MIINKKYNFLVTVLAMALANSAAMAAFDSDGFCEEELRMATAASVASAPVAAKVYAHMDAQDALIKAAQKGVHLSESERAAAAQKLYNDRAAGRAYDKESNKQLVKNAKQANPRGSNVKPSDMKDGNYTAIVGGKNLKAFNQIAAGHTGKYTNRVGKVAGASAELNSKEARTIEGTKNAQKVAEIRKAGNETLNRNIKAASTQAAVKQQAATKVAAQVAVDNRAKEIRSLPMLSQKLDTASVAWKNAASQTGVKFTALTDATLAAAKSYADLDGAKKAAAQSKAKSVLAAISQVKVSPTSAEGKKIAVIKKLFAGQALSVKDRVVLRESGVKAKPQFAAVASQYKVPAGSIDTSKPDFAAARQVVANQIGSGLGGRVARK